MKMTTDGVGLYVHIPFCVKKCAYCDFCSFPYDEIKNRAEYIDALCSEIRSYKNRGIFVDSVFFGGGTPSLLSGVEFKKILDAIRETFDVALDAEFTMEANPKTLKEENLRDYISCGVNRISLGVQTIHQNELKKLGRIHNFDDFLSTYRLVRKCGIKNVSVDLMYGLPDQTKESFGETLDKIIELEPEHISVYGLIVEEGTFLSEHVSEYSLPSEDEECDMYYLASEKLKAGGYLHYEISNYTKEGFACKHNLKYWRNREYIGVGVAAYSYFDSRRFGNSRDLCRYIADYSLAREYDENVDVETARYEYAMLALRLHEGFSLDEYQKLFGVDFLQGKEDFIKKLCESDLLLINNGRISLTEKGFYVSNYILSELL